MRVDEVDFDGVDDYCSIPKAIILFKVYKRAFSDEEIKQLYLGNEEFEDDIVARGIALIINKKDTTRYIIIMTNKQ